MCTDLCFFVQTHRDPELILRLVRTLHRGSDRARVVIQHNFAAGPLDWTPFAELPRTHLFQATAPQIRAHYSCQMQPLLEMIDWLEKEAISYDWLVTLTGQDYPTVSTPRLEAELAATASDGFLRSWDVDSAENPWSWRKARNRYHFRYRRWPDAVYKVLRAVRLATRLLPIHFYLDYGPFVGRRVWTTPFTERFRLHGGWAWFSLRRSAVLYLRDFLAENPEVVRHYRGTITPEESLVQTVLVNSGRFDLTNDDRRYIDYSKAYKGSPRVLTEADLPMLAAGSFHFARKFDPGVDLAILDRIDAELLAAP